MTLSFNAAQRQIIDAPPAQRIFAAGRAGAGKTSAAVERLRRLLSLGVPADSILLLAPQRTVHEPYLEVLQSPERAAGGEALPTTIGGLARRACGLFWSLAAEEAGFKRPEKPPVFLTLETAQYYMARLVRPQLDKGFFESLTIDRNRLYSQLLDNLNKAAAVGFPHTEIGARLDSAWFGDPAQRRIYQDAQECANRFRAYCLEHNLLDFSLQLEVFLNILWRREETRQYFKRAYRCLIYDNVEEDIPRAHDLIAEWLPDFDSALLIYDSGAGYRYFLSGDARSGWALADACDERVEFSKTFVQSRDVAELSETLTAAILRQESGGLEAGNALEFISGAASNALPHFYPEMLDGVTARVKALTAEGIPPSEIVILAPYLSDALRFSIAHRLEAAGIPWRSHRPSRSLRDEPASRALLTLSALAHPQWKVRPSKFDVARALMFALDADLIRAQLLTEIVYRQRDLSLSTFDQIKPEIQERITYALGERFAALRNWIEEYRRSSPVPLDFFLRRLFGEALSQRGFGFHDNLDAVRAASSLVESVKKFRQAMEPAMRDLSGLTESRDDIRLSDEDLTGLGKEYIAMLEDGVIAAQYLEAWRSEDKDAVLVAPAHTFLLMNRPASVQFWLDPGSSGWVQRPAQPLTHPYVLSRHWDASQGRVWSDADEVQAEIEALARLAGGLLCRCREKVILALSDLGESGYEQRGALLRAFQRALQHVQP